MNFIRLKTDSARQALDNGQLARALAIVTELFRQLQFPEGGPPLPTGLREADVILEEIAQRLWKTTPLSPDQTLKGDCIVATVTYVCGGHTAVIKDLTAALHSPPRALWLTMAHPEALGLRKDSLERTGLAAHATIFPGYTSLECARLMFQALRELKPERLFLLHHPDDCVAPLVAVTARNMGTQVIMLHHADTNPSSGLFLPGIRVVDFTPRSYLYTHHTLGISSFRLPLTCPDPGESPTSFLQRGKLTTALSGSYPKVAAISSPSYPELVAEILAASGGWHVHIGPLPERALRKLQERLRAKGIPLDRLIWVPLVPSVSRALHEYAVDLVINTYPQGGARLAVEVMAAGLPMVWQSRQVTQDKMQAQMAYPEAALWRTVDELTELIQNIDRAWLEDQGKSARNWFCRYHHPDIWRDFFSNRNVNCDINSPELPSLDTILASVGNHLLEARALNRPGLLEGIHFLVGRMMFSLYDRMKWRAWPILARTLKIFGWRSLRWK